ncbi:nuclear transport factor 2 family protein [Candidatus Bathyarchaeota archaeon]|nr:nuclear transport factor 2 family protein [Candidatus Bathyarchaeota archaeon]
MADNKIASIMREFVKTPVPREIEKKLSFFTEDAVLVTPDGTFRGKEGLRRSLLSESMRDATVTETGNGIIVEGNNAFFEHVISGMYRGKRFEFLAICAYEFSGEKIKHVRTVYDRLLVAKQVAPGWLARSIVNSIVNRFEKGLR